MDILQQAEEAAKGREASERLIIRAFAEHAKSIGARDKDQVGARTVISYWKHLTKAHTKHQAQIQHWKVLCELWVIWKKLGEPPEPWMPKINTLAEVESQTATA